MADLISIQINPTRVIEGSQVIATVNIRNGADAEPPTTLEWGLYSDSQDRELQDWTTVTAASSTTITIPAHLNSCRDAFEMDRLCFRVAVDRGLSTALISQAKYQVIDVGGYRYDDRNYITDLLDQSYDFILDESGQRITTDA